MGRNFIYTNSNSYDLGEKKRSVERKFHIGPKAVRFIAVIIFSAMGVLYLTQTTNGAGQSLQVRELSAEKTQLSEQLDRLKIEQSRLESLNQINQGINPQPTVTESLSPTLVPATTANHLPN
jgi:cell division protein FtsB